MQGISSESVRVSAGKAKNGNGEFTSNKYSHRTKDY